MHENPHNFGATPVPTSKWTPGSALRSGWSSQSSFDGRRGVPGVYCRSFSATLGVGASGSDRLQTPADVSLWLFGVGLTSELCNVTVPFFRRARDLREAIHRLLIATSLDEPLAEADRLAVNEHARQPRRQWQLTADWKKEPLCPTDAVAAALAAIAVDAVNTLTTHHYNPARSLGDPVSTTRTWV